MVAEQFIILHIPLVTREYHGSLSDKLDHVIGKITHGFMGPNEAAYWLEHESGQIADTLDKARE